MTKETVPSTDLWAQTRWALQAEQNGRKGKGCNIGYALAANSYERANSVDACTVAALDAITAFAVPNPSYSSRAVGFFGFGGSTSYLVKRITQPTSGGQCYLDQPFQPSTIHKISFPSQECSDVAHQSSKHLLIYCGIYLSSKIVPRIVDGIVAKCEGFKSET